MWDGPPKCRAATLQAASCKAEHCSHLKPQLFYTLAIWSSDGVLLMATEQILRSGDDNLCRNTTPLASWSVARGYETHQHAKTAGCT